MKKVLAVFLSMVMLLGMIPGITANAEEVQNNEQQIVNAGGANPTDGQLNEDGVSISKVLEPTSRENYFDITLSVKTTKTREEIIQAQTTDIVIVMDVSYTMNSKQGDGSTRLSNAKAAANTFVDLYCSDTSIGQRNLSFVTFDTDATKQFTKKGVGSGDIASLQSSINSVKTEASNSDERYTNIEGGLRLAQNILDASDAQYKYIVLLTDGFPTTYISSNASDLNEIQGYVPATSSYNSSTINNEGVFVDSVLGYACKYGTSYSDIGAQKAQDEAAAIKNSMNIFSVGIDIGGQSVQNYVNQANHQYSFSVVDRRGEDYVIGSATDGDAYRNWLRNSIAGGPDLAASEETRYCDGNNKTQLENAYKNILTEIKVINEKAIADAYIVADPMGEQVEFQHFYTSEGEISGNALTGSNAVGAESTASYSADTHILNWNLFNSGYTQSQEGNTTIYTYTVKYCVRLENELPGFAGETQAYDTNGNAVLNYKVDINGKLTDEKSLDFPIPSVTGYYDELQLKKVSSIVGDDGALEPVSGAQFTLTHNSDCQVCEGKVQIADIVSDLSAEDGTVSITGIPSGHHYTLTETVTPEGYIEGGVYDLEASYGKVYLNGSEVTNEAPGIIENEPFAPAVTVLEAVKTLKGADLEEGQFQFELKDDSGNVIDTKKNDADGKVTFDELSFDQVGTFTYTISEVIPEEKDANITYDETVYTVEITVELDDEENPTAYVITEQTITKGEEEVTSIEFANEYTNKTPNKTPDNTDKTVKTGDDTNILLSLILVGGSLVTIVACAFSRRRARR